MAMKMEPKDCDYEHVGHPEVHTESPVPSQTETFGNLREPDAMYSFNLLTRGLDQEQHQCSSDVSADSMQDNVVFLPGTFAQNHRRRHSVTEYANYTISHCEAELNSKLLPKKYRCRFCVYKTSYKSDLNRHLRKHGIAPQHCPLCNMPFKTTGNLENHMRQVHGTSQPRLSREAARAGEAGSPVHEMPAHRYDAAHDEAQSSVHGMPAQLYAGGNEGVPAGGGDIIMPGIAVSLVKPSLLRPPDRLKDQTPSGAEPRQDFPARTQAALLQPQLSCHVCPFVCSDAEVLAQHLLAHPLEKDVRDEVLVTHPSEKEVFVTQPSKEVLGTHLEKQVFAIHPLTKQVSVIHPSEKEILTTHSLDNEVLATHPLQKELSTTHSLEKEVLATQPLEEEVLATQPLEKEVLATQPLEKEVLATHPLDKPCRVEEEARAKTRTAEAARRRRKRVKRLLQLLEQHPASRALARLRPAAAGGAGTCPTDRHATVLASNSQPEGHRPLNLVRDHGDGRSQKIAEEIGRFVSRLNASQGSKCKPSTQGGPGNPILLSDEKRNRVQDYKQSTTGLVSAGPGQEKSCVAKAKRAGENKGEEKPMLLRHEMIEELKKTVKTRKASDDRSNNFLVIPSDSEESFSSNVEEKDASTAWSRFHLTLTGKDKESRVPFANGKRNSERQTTNTKTNHDSPMDYVCRNSTRKNQLTMANQETRMNKHKLDSSDLRDKGAGNSSKLLTRNLVDGQQMPFTFESSHTLTVPKPKTRFLNNFLYPEISLEQQGQEEETTLVLDEEQKSLCNTDEEENHESKGDVANTVKEQNFVHPLNPCHLKRDLNKSRFGKHQLDSRVDLIQNLQDEQKDKGMHGSKTNGSFQHQPLPCYSEESEEEMDNRIPRSEQTSSDKTQPLKANCTQSFNEGIQAFNTTTNTLNIRFHSNKGFRSPWSDPGFGVAPKADCSRTNMANAYPEPTRGRFVRLESDFDEFSVRPFACALCFFRTPSLRELARHVDNHLTGGAAGHVPETARFAPSEMPHADLLRAEDGLLTARASSTAASSPASSACFSSVASERHPESNSFVGKTNYVNADSYATPETFFRNRKVGEARETRAPTEDERSTFSCDRMTNSPFQKKQNLYTFKRKARSTATFQVGSGDVSLAPGELLSQSCSRRGETNVVAGGEKVTQQQGPEKKGTGCGSGLVENRQSDKSIFIVDPKEQDLNSAESHAAPTGRQSPRQKTRTRKRNEHQPKQLGSFREHTGADNKKLRKMGGFEEVRSHSINIDNPKKDSEEKVTNPIEDFDGNVKLKTADHLTLSAFSQRRGNQCLPKKKNNSIGGKRKRATEKVRVRRTYLNDTNARHWVRKKSSKNRRAYRTLHRSGARHNDIYTHMNGFKDKSFQHHRSYKTNHCKEECKECGKRFSLRLMLTRHVRIIHGGKQTRQAIHKDTGVDSRT